MNSLFLILILIFATTKIKDKNICKCVYGVIAILIFNQLYDGYCNFVVPTGYTMVGATNDSCLAVTLGAGREGTDCNAVPGCFYDTTGATPVCRAISTDDQITSDQLSAAYPECADGGTPGEPVAYALPDGTPWALGMTLDGSPLASIPPSCNLPAPDLVNVLTLSSCTEAVGSSLCSDHTCTDGTEAIPELPADTEQGTDAQGNCCQTVSNDAPMTCADVKSGNGEACGVNGFKYDIDAFTDVQKSQFDILLNNNANLNNIAVNLTTEIISGTGDLQTNQEDFDRCCKSQIPCHLHFKGLDSDIDNMKVHTNATGEGLPSGAAGGGGGPIPDGTDPSGLVPLTCPGNGGRPQMSDGRNYERISSLVGFTDSTGVNDLPSLSEPNAVRDIFSELSGRLCQGRECNLSPDSLDLQTCCRESFDCKEDVIGDADFSRWFNPELLDDSPTNYNKLTHYLAGFDGVNGLEAITSLEQLCSDPLETNPLLREPSNLDIAKENAYKHLKRFKSGYRELGSDGTPVEGSAPISITDDFFNDTVCGSSISAIDNLLHSHVRNKDIHSRCCDTSQIFEDEDDIDPTETDCGPILSVIGS